MILVDGRVEGGWRKLNGEVLTERMLRAHVTRILAGELSLEGGNSDAALIEPLIRTHPDFARLVPFGLPDIRIICLGDVPLMAMTRLPTVEAAAAPTCIRARWALPSTFATGRSFARFWGRTRSSITPPPMPH